MFSWRFVLGGASEIEFERRSRPLTERKLSGLAATQKSCQDQESGARQSREVGCLISVLVAQACESAPHWLRVFAMEADPFLLPGPPLPSGTNSPEHEGHRPVGFKTPPKHNQKKRWY